MKKFFMDEWKKSSKALWLLDLKKVPSLLFQTEMFRLLTDKQRREYNHPEVLMNTNHTHHRKELTALDADVPLLRPSLIRFNVSELRLFPIKADCVYARHLHRFGAVR